MSWETLGVADKLGVAGTLASWLCGAAVGVYCEALPENCRDASVLTSRRV